MGGGVAGHLEEAMDDSDAVRDVDRGRAMGPSDGLFRGSGEPGVLSASEAGVAGPGEELTVLEDEIGL